jgi:hypothetical protein
MAKMTCLLAALLLAVAPDPAAAQVRADTSLASVLETAKARRWILRVSTDSTVHDQGMLTRLTPDSFRIGAVEFSLTDEIAVDRRVLDRSNIRAVTLAGTFTGLGAGALLVLWRCSSSASVNCPNDGDYALVFGMTFTGATLGALTGGLFGGNQWMRIWPDP